MKYRATFTRDISESTTIEVEADSQAQAEEEAWERYHEYKGTLNWQIDDAQPGDADLNEVEEI